AGGSGRRTRVGGGDDCFVIVWCAPRTARWTGGVLRRGAVATTGVDTAGRGTTAGRVVTPGYGSGAGAEAPGLGSGPAVAGEEEAARAGVADPSARTRLAAAKGRSNDEAFIGLSDLPFAANAAWTLRGTQVLRTPRSSRHE